jgi:hypothetical protein
MAGQTPSVYDETTATAFYRSFTNPSLRKITLKTIVTIFYQFFFRQYRAALLPGRVSVTPVDHELDAKIPFTPSWVAVYLDFVSFWVRTLSFLYRAYGRRIYKRAGEFLETMGKLYTFAAGLYKKNFSTTRRPFYIARPRFFLIHLVDPHLMCVPSLHVMVVIRTYTKFREIVRAMGDEALFAPQIAELKKGALAISEAILFVKQHSVNCIPAALYAMTRFEEALFPPKEAEDFCSRLFVQSLPPEDGETVRAHIMKLYREFLAEGAAAGNWDEPLLSFLRRYGGRAQGPR